jgi:hypothetical protein
MPPRSVGIGFLRDRVCIQLTYDGTQSMGVFSFIRSSRVVRLRGCELKRDQLTIEFSCLKLEFLSGQRRCMIVHSEPKLIHFAHIPQSDTPYDCDNDVSP